MVKFSSAMYALGTTERQISPNFRIFTYFP